jgi:hypothetical protein
MSKDIKEKFETNKDKIVQNINMGRSMGVNKITAILAMDDESEEIQSKLINWLLIEGYKVSLKKEDYSILIIEW